MKAIRRRQLSNQLPDAIEVETDVGVLLLPADDQVMRPLMQRTGSWELDEAILVGALISRGETVVDIGAHVGYYTLLASRAVGRRGHVVAFEPQPGNAALLRANVARNGARNVRVIEAAAWSEPTRLTLRCDPANSGDNRIARDSDSDAVSVTGVRVDSVIDRANVIKIDAQGTDHVALRGLSGLVALGRTTALVEFWPHGVRAFGDDPLAVIEEYRSLGYRLTMPGVQADFDGWPASRFVEVAELLPGGFATLVLR